MLGLHLKTPDTWAAVALAQPADLLLDHYFAEKKAAAMALRTMKLHAHKYPLLKKLMPPLAEEEEDHADTVQKLIRSNFKWPEAPKGGSLYVKGLRGMADGKGHGQFLDMLLVCSLVEARSAERFKLLADYTRGTSFGNFYEDFYAAEVNHYLLFINLAADIFGVDVAEERMEIFRAEEAKLILAMPVGPRIHSGIPAIKEG